MYGINASRRRQKGASLISAVFLITALAIIAALMTKLTHFTSAKSVKTWYATQALYAAESAISAATYDIINNDNCAARNNISVSINSDSSASYSISCYQPGLNGITVNFYKITATATSGSGNYQAQRRIIVQFIP